MTTQTRQEYFTLRRKGWRANDALSAAKILSGWKTSGGYIQHLGDFIRDSNGGFVELTSDRLAELLETQKK